MDERDDAAGVIWKRSGDVGVLTLNRADRGNALDGAMVLGLAQAFRSAAVDDNVRAVLLAASGRHFSVGGDVEAFAGLAGQAPEARRVAFADLLSSAREMMLAMAAVPVPIVAACRGTIAGGAIGLALAADLVFADDSTIFRFSHGDAGVPPDGGVSWFLPRLVGPRIAARLLLEGAAIPATDALALGLVSHQVDRGCAEDSAMAAATRLASNPGAIHARRLLRQSAENSLAQQLPAEAEAVVDAVGAPVFPETVRALAARLKARPGRS